MVKQSFTCGRAYVKYKGPYNWDLLYRTIWNWLTEREYETQDKRYKDKKASPDGNELKVDIVGERRQTGYTRLNFKVKIRSWDMKEKMVEVDGEKRLISGGRLFIEIKGGMDLDWQNVFSGSPFKVGMGKFYDWVMKKEHEQLLMDDQEYEVIRLETEIKKVLNMEASFNAFENSN